MQEKTVSDFRREVDDEKATPCGILAENVAMHKKKDPNLPNIMITSD